MVETTDDKKKGKLYWGAMPLPKNAELVGTVTRDNSETGALIKMPTGKLVQGNAGVIRNLPTISKKAKSTYYIDADQDQEMRIHAAEMGLRYPSEFILMLWKHYKDSNKKVN